MARAIGHFILGVKLPDTLCETEDFIDFLDEKGIESFQSYNGDWYIGVEIENTQIDEARDMDWDQIIATKEKLSQANGLSSASRSQFHSKIKPVLEDTGTSSDLRQFLSVVRPAIYLIWGSS